MKCGPKEKAEEESDSNWSDINGVIGCSCINQTKCTLVTNNISSAFFQEVLGYGMVLFQTKYTPIETKASLQK